MTKVIGFHYTLKNDAGEVLDSSVGGDPMLYLAGSGQILMALDAAISGLAVGDKKSVSLSAKEGYGEINPAFKMNVKLGQFPPGTDVKVGLQFRISNEPGSPMFRVMNVLGASTYISKFNSDVRDVLDPRGANRGHYLQRLDCS